MTNMSVRRDDSTPWQPGMFLYTRTVGSGPTITIPVSTALNSCASGLVKYGRAAMLANHAIERMMSEED